METTQLKLRQLPKSRVHRLLRARLVLAFGIGVATNLLGATNSLASSNLNTSITAEFQDHPIARQWFTKAQDGDPKAEYLIGDMYYQAVDTENNYRQARHWLKRAANQDYVPALLALGLMYELGLGGNKDLAQANEYYARAIGADNPSFGPLSEDAITDQRDTLENSKGRLAMLTGVKRALQTEYRGVRKGLEPGEHLRLAVERAELSLAKQRQVHDGQVQQLQSGRENMQQLLEQLDDSGYQGRYSKQAINAFEKAVSQDRQTLLEQYDAIAKDEQKRQQILARVNAPAESSRNDAVLAMGPSSARSETLQRYLSDLENSIQHRTVTTEKRQQKLAFLEKRIARLKQSTARTISSDEKVVLRRALTEIDHRYQGKINYLATNLANEVERVDVLSTELSVAEKANKDKEQYITTIKHQLNRATNLVDRQSKLVKQQSSDLQKAIDQMNAAHATAGQVNAIEHTPSKSANRPTKSTIAIKWPVTTSIGEDAVAEVAAGQVINVVGAAYSTEDLARFSINDNEQALDSNGLFMTAVEMGAYEQTLVFSMQDVAGNITKSVLTLKPQNTTAVALRTREQTPDPSNLKEVPFGRYHALVIGNNDYNSVGLDALDTAVNDANAVADILQKRYGFEVSLVLNATRDAILQAMEDMRRKLNENDNLLIYYAGHGIVDPENNQGYWIPVDGTNSSTARWLSNATISDQIRAMNARNVMVIADSCYSGSLMRSGIMSLRSGLTPEKKMRRLREDVLTSTRVALSSGGLQPVADSINNSPNSVFTGAMLKILGENDQLLDADSLATTVGHMVAVATKDSVKQVPRYAPLLKAGHEGGEFYFVPTQWRAGKKL